MNERRMRRRGASCPVFLETISPGLRAVNRNQARPIHCSSRSVFLIEGGDDIKNITRIEEAHELSIVQKKPIGHFGLRRTAGPARSPHRLGDGRRRRRYVQLRRSDGQPLALQQPGDGFDVAARRRPDLLKGVVIIKGKALAATKNADGSVASQKEQDFLAIPYYAWSHRGTGERAVWITRK